MIENLKCNCKLPLIQKNSRAGFRLKVFPGKTGDRFEYSCALSTTISFSNCNFQEVVSGQIPGETGQLALNAVGQSGGTKEVQR